MRLQKLPYAKYVDAYNKRFVDRTVFVECGETAWENCNDYYSYIDPAINTPRLPEICGNHLALPLGYHYDNFFFPVADSTVVMNWPNGADDAVSLCNYLVDRCHAKGVLWFDEKHEDVRKFVAKEVAHAA